MKTITYNPATAVFLAMAVIIAGLSVFAIAPQAHAQSICSVGIVDLTVGSRGAAVTCLQQSLIAKKFVIPAGATGYFGAQTRAAVSAWQSAKGVAPAVGYFGTLSRAQWNAEDSGGTGGSTSTVPGCQPGALFSSTTGQSCGGSSTVPGCLPGYAFSPTTGQSCSDTSSTPNPNPVTLSGANGMINDVNMLSQFNNEEVGEGASSVKVLGFEVEASNDGDIKLNSLKLSFDPTGTSGSTRLEKYVRRVDIWQGDKKVGAAEVTDFNRGSGNVYSRTIVLNDSVIVKSRSNEQFYVTITAASSIDSADMAGDAWTLDVDSIRYTDGSGVTTTDTNTGDINAMNVPVNFVPFSTAANTKLRISLDQDSPAEDIVFVKGTSDTKNVTLLKGALKVEGKSDVTIDELPVTLIGSGVADVDSMTNSITLTLGGKTYTESVTTSAATATVTFDNLNFTIRAGQTVDFTLAANINKFGGDFDEGDMLEARITSTNRDFIDAENENGDNLTTTEKQGVALGHTQELRTSGISVTFVSASTDISSGQSSDDDLASFKLRFTVKAIGDTVYVSSVAGSGGFNFAVDRAGQTVSSGTSAVVTDNTDSRMTSNGNYQIDEGREETFELSVTAQLPDAGTAGLYRAALTGIAWDTEDISVLDHTYISRLSSFKTSYIGVN